MDDQELVLFAQRVLGRRYVTDFTVVAIGPGAVAALALRDGTYTVSLDELQALLDSGLMARVEDGQQQTSH